MTFILSEASEVTDEGPNMTITLFSLSLGYSGSCLTLGSGVEPGKVLWQSQQSGISELYVIWYFLLSSWKSPRFNADTSQVSTAALNKNPMISNTSILWTNTRDHNHMQQG